MTAQVELSKQTTKNDSNSKTGKNNEDDVQYCEFCGVSLEQVFGTKVVLRRKYCSTKCRNIATSRLARARLGVPPPKRSVSKLSNPLYFN